MSGEITKGFKTTLGVVLALLVVALVFAAGPRIARGVGSLISKAPESATEAGADLGEAWRKCRFYLDDYDQLAPPNAKYPTDAPGPYTTDLGDGRYRIEAWFEGPHYLPDIGRKNFICDIEYLGESEWKLIDLTLHE